MKIQMNILRLKEMRRGDIFMINRFYIMIVESNSFLSDPRVHLINA